MRLPKIKAFTSILLTICMALFPAYPIPLAHAGIPSAPAANPATGLINSFAIETVTGSAIYYVGGYNESGNQEGTQLAPFASLSAAMQTINTLGAGSFELQVQGDTIETEEIRIGDGSAEINVTVLGPDNGMATVKRESNYLGNMFRIEVGSSLTFGQASDPADSNQLLIDGNYKVNILNSESATNYSSAGTIVMNYGNTILNNGVTLMNNKGGYEHISGGAIYNSSGTFIMNGGSIKLNTSERGGAIYNSALASIRIFGGTLSGNTAQSGGAVFNEDTANLLLSGGSFTGNVSADHYGNGIYNMDSGKVQMSGNIVMSREDDICLVSSQENASTPYIMIGGALTATNAVYHVTKKLDTSGILTDSVMIGDQGLQGTENYTITASDAAKFLFQTTDLTNNMEYLVNMAGYLIRSNSDSIVTVYPDITPVPNLTGTPTPTPIPIRETIALGNGVGELEVMLHQPMGDGSLTAEFNLSEEGLPPLEENNSSDTPRKLSIPLASEKLLQMFGEGESTSLQLTLTIPDNILKKDRFEISDIALDPAILEAAKATGKNVTISVKNEYGQEQYSWTFSGANLKNSDQQIGPVNLSLSIGDITDDSAAGELLSQSQGKGLIVDFGHDGELPAQSSVRIYVGDREGMKPGERIYLYHYNTELNMLETLPYSAGYVIGEDGYITIDLLHCSSYLIMGEPADSTIVISLKDQIKVTPMNKVLYVGGTKDSQAEIEVELPSTLELVNSFEDRTSGSAVGAVTVSYRSSNRNIVMVDQNGRIKAVGTGSARIYAKFTLYSGKTTVIMISINVEKADLVITRSVQEMQVGEKFTFEAVAYGYAGKITWDTTKDSIVVIDKKTGKANAKAQGTDYVTVKVGNVVKTVKVVVINRNVYRDGSR